MGIDENRVGVNGKEPPQAGGITISHYSRIYYIKKHIKLIMYLW
jgi:hypothetical protein